MQRNHGETSLMIDERQPVQISGSISTSPQSAGRETLLFLLREGGAERAEYSRPLKMHRDILSGGTSPTSERGTKTVWKLMDKCIFDISAHFVRWYIWLQFGWDKQLHSDRESLDVELMTERKSVLSAQLLPWVIWLKSGRVEERQLNRYEGKESET